MFIIISSAKTLKLTSKNQKGNSEILFPNITNQIIKICQSYSAEELSLLLNISPKLAELNHQRFQHFGNSSLSSAIFTYNGDVYNNINAESLSQKQLDFLHSHLFIVSGLYGLLRPLDDMRPYRLEMSTKLANLGQLSTFWQREITQYINEKLANHKTKYLINLASTEYSSAIDLAILKYPMINIHFKENKDGLLKTIGINAKKARGRMVNFIAKNSIDLPDNLKDFQELNYNFSKEHSSNSEWIFIK